MAKVAGAQKKIGGLKKPPKQGKVGGVQTAFSNRIAPSIGGKR